MCSHGTCLRSIWSVRPRTSSRTRSTPPAVPTYAPARSRARSSWPPRKQSRATWCCSRRPAQATTSTRISRSGARTSGGWWRTSPEGAKRHVSDAPRTVRGRRAQCGEARARESCRHRREVATKSPREPGSAGREPKAVRGVTKRGAEWHVLTLVTLGLTAFGIVMVYSATSASAAIGGANPMSYLERQGTYAMLGLALMLAASRFDYRRLRALAPVLVLVALGGCAAVLVVAQPINGARRWVGFGPAAFQPSEVAKLALAIWISAYLAKREPPRSLQEVWRPIGVLVGLFSVLILIEPDLGTTIAIGVMIGGVLLVAGTPLRTLAGAMSIATMLGIAAVWIEPYRRARVFSFLDPW